VDEYACSGGAAAKYIISLFHIYGAVISHSGKKTKMAENKLMSAAKATRGLFLPASLLPFLTGAVYAAKCGYPLGLSKLILGFAGVGAMHLAGNIFNDYYDYLRGADDPGRGKSPFFGGSLVIQEGKLTAAQVLGLALFFAAAAAACGLAICWITRDPAFIVLMALTAFLTLEYTAPPLKLAYRMLGELDIFLLFGVILVPGSFYLFAGTFSRGALLLSLPLAFLVTAIILCNELPDLNSDAGAGKHNLVFLAGKERGFSLYLLCVALSAVSIVLNIQYGCLAAPPYSLFYFTGWG